MDVIRRSGFGEEGDVEENQSLYRARGDICDSRSITLSAKLTEITASLDELW